jgi:hypothetical protein
MANEMNDEYKAEDIDETFLKASGEARRLEREALPSGTKVFPSGSIFEEFDIEKIATDSYEAALRDALQIESKVVVVAKKAEEKVEWAGQKAMSEKELENIPHERVEVLTRSEQEILDEEKKLKDMKDKFAKLMSEAPEDKPQAPREEKVVAEAPREKISVLGTPKAEPEKPKEAAPMNIATGTEYKPAAGDAKADEIRELSENFKKITMKKEEREKQERIRKMKKEIEDMLESG